MNRHTDDVRYERELAFKNSLVYGVSKPLNAAGSAGSGVHSATFDAFMRMASGKEGRTIADKISDANRPTWDEYRAKHEAALDMSGTALKKMAEYRKTLDAGRDATLAVGLNKATHGKATAAISDDDGSSTDGKKRKKGKHRKKKDKKESNQKRDIAGAEQSPDRASSEYATFLRGILKEVDDGANNEEGSDEDDTWGKPLADCPWACPACAHANPGGSGSKRKLHCQSCGQLSPVALKEATRAAAAAGDGRWACAACSTLNVSGTLACDACNALRVSLVVGGSCLAAPAQGNPGLSLHAALAAAGFTSQHYAFQAEPKSSALEAAKLQAKLLAATARAKAIAASVAHAIQKEGGYPAAHVPGGLGPFEKGEAAAGPLRLEGPVKGSGRASRWGGKATEPDVFVVERVLSPPAAPTSTKRPSRWDVAITTCDGVVRRSSPQ